MDINVTYMGGAAAGIMGSSDASNDILNDLKKNSISFAQEYQKPNKDQAKLADKADQISGSLQTLQITNTLSVLTVDDLLNQLDKLMVEAN